MEPTKASGRRRRALVAGLLAVLLVACFTPSLAFGFGFDTDPFRLGPASRKSLYPRLVAGGDSIHAFWAGRARLTASSFGDSGHTPGSDWILSECNPACMTDSWRIAAAGSRAWATWVQMERVEGVSWFLREQVYFAASTDSGASWGEPKRLSDGSGVAWFPEIAAADNKAYVVWEDFKGLRMRTIVGDVPRPGTRQLTTAFRHGSARVAAADDFASDHVTVGWDDRTGVTLESSDDAGATFPNQAIRDHLQLDGLARSAQHVRALASDPHAGPVVVLSSADAGDSYSTVGLLSKRHCELGCSTGDVAALDDRVAVAYQDDGKIYVASGRGSSLGTEQVAASGGFPQVALSSNATGVVWTIRSTELQQDGTIAAARPDGAGKWTVLGPTEFWGAGTHPNTFLPEIAGLNTGFGLAFMAFDSPEGAILPGTAFQPTYRHADAADPNLALLGVTATQAVDGANLIKGKPTKFLVKVRNTTGRVRAVKARLTTRDDGGSETSRPVSVQVKSGTTTLLIPGVDEPAVRPTGHTSLSWSVELDSEHAVDEVDETDNLAVGSERVEVPVPELRVLFVPVRVGGSPHPTCGGTTRATRELERALDAHHFVDAVMPLDDRTSTYTTSCAALTYPGPTVSTTTVLDDLGAISLAGDHTKVVGVTEDGFFKHLDNDPKERQAVGLAYRPKGEGLYRCADGLLMENGIAADANTSLLGGGVLGHEILHTAGFDHTKRTSAPGTWVDADSQLDGTYLNLLDEFAIKKPWITKATYDEVSSTVLDPQMSCTQPTFLRRAAPAAALAPGPTLAIGGRIDAAGVVTAEPFYERDTVPDVALGAHGEIEARLLDDGGATLDTTSFDAHDEKSEGDDTAPGTPGVGSFLTRVPLPAGTRRVQLYRDGVLRFDRTRSAAAPTVTVSAPNGGETFTAGDDVTVDWAAADGDGDTLHHMLALSTDDGETWTPLAADVTASSFTFTATDTMVSDTVRVRVDTSDGWRTASDTSDASFTIVAGAGEGRIAYVKNIRARCGDLMTVAPDGSDTQTVVPGNNCHPRWSPDGTQILFEGDGDITVVNADGTGLHAVVDTCVASAPDWSPDGTRIVFVDECGQTLKTIGADGTGLVDLGVQALSGVQPTWSPAGDRIAFYSRNPTDELVFVDPDGGNRTSFPLTIGLGTAEWSPDATRLVYTGANGVLWTVNADGTDKTQIGATPTDGVGADREFGATWSPDGDRIVFSRAGLTSSEQWYADELAIEEADGSGVVQVTHDAGAVLEVFPDWQPVPARSDAPVVAAAGGPYAGPEGSAIALDAGGSTAAAAYAWDLDGDGEFDDATGSHASLTPAGHGQFGVAVQVTDAAGHTDVADASVTVANVDPAVSFESPGSIDPEGRASIAARVGDPGDADLAVTVDWHDGTPLEAVPLLLRSPGAGDVLAVHDYDGPGPHTATVHADDGDGGTGQATTGFTAVPANQAPTVGDAAAKTLVGEPVAVDVPTADPDGNPVQLTVASGPSHGTAEAVAGHGLERLVVYTPASGFHGTDVFTVTGSDGRGGTASGTVTITVAEAPGVTPQPAGPIPTPTPSATPAAPKPVPPVAADAACANGQLRLTDVYPDGRRVRIAGVAPVAARGQKVAITFTATRKRVATARVAPDLSFKTTVPLPARRLRSSNRARYVATFGGQRSRALKLTRRMFLRSVTVAGNRLSVTGQVVKPLARKRSDRTIILRIATSCAAAASRSAGRELGFQPAASGRFRRTIKLTARERSAQALYVRARTRVGRGGRSTNLIRTFSLTRGVSTR